MALTTVDQLLVKRASLTSDRSMGGAAALALKGFWMGRNQQGLSGKLYLLKFADLGADAVVSDAAAKVHFIYCKKQATATDSFYKIFDDTANDATAADAVLGIALTGSGDEQWFASVKGLDCAAGVVHGAYTAFLGFNASTPSTSGDGPDGFIILGDA